MKKFIHQLFAILMVLVMLFDAVPVAVLAEGENTQPEAEVTMPVEGENMQPDAEGAASAEGENTQQKAEGETSAESGNAAVETNPVSRGGQLGVEKANYHLLNTNEYTVTSVTGSFDRFLDPNYVPGSASQAEGTRGLSEENSAASAADTQAVQPKVVMAPKMSKRSMGPLQAKGALGSDQTVNTKGVETESVNSNSLTSASDGESAAEPKASDTAAEPKRASEPEASTVPEVQQVKGLVAYEIELNDGVPFAEEYDYQVKIPVGVNMLAGKEVSGKTIKMIGNGSYRLFHLHTNENGTIKEEEITTVSVNQKDGTITDFSFTVKEFSTFVLVYTVDFVYIEKKTEISIDLDKLQKNGNELGQLLYKNSKGLEELAVSDILDFAQDYLQDENVCGEVYTVSLQNGTALSDFDQNFFANSAVSIEGKGIEYGFGKITLLESFDEAKITFASEAGTLELTLENYTAPEKPVVPETEEGFSYRFFTGSATVEEILAANEIVSPYYNIVSLSDTDLVTVDGDTLTAQDSFDAVTLTVALSDGTEVEIILSNPAPVQAWEIVATEGVGSFAATEDVPAGTMLVVNDKPVVPEGIVLPSNMRKGGPAESDPVFFEVSLVGPDGEPVKAGADVTLNTAIKLPEAPEGQIVKVTGVKVYHIGEKGDAEELEGATYALAEGKISSVSFTTPGFSLFAITYTVDFVSAEVNKAWSWPGEGSYSVADIMTEIGVTGDIESVDLVRTDDQGGSDKALYLEEREDGHYLVSEEAFVDTFMLTVVVDGVTYHFTVTDEMTNTTTTGRIPITGSTEHVTGYQWSLESDVTYNESEEKYTAELKVNFAIQPQYIDTVNGYYIELGNDISLPESMLNRNFVARDGVKNMNSFMYRYVRQANGKYAVLIDYYPEYVNSYYVNNEWTGPITDNYINFVALIEKITTNNQSQQVIQITDTLQVTVPDDKIEYPENEDKNNSIHGQKAYSGYTIDNDGKIHVIYTAHISSSKGTESAVQVTDVLNTYIHGNPGYTSQEGNPAISSVAITGFKKNGSDQTVPTVTPTVETNKITMAYEVPQMAANDYYDVTYEYVYDKAFLKNTNTTDSYTIQYGGSNELTLVTGTLQDTANASFDITKTNDVVKLQKGNGYDANEQAINWSIWVSFNGNNGTRTVVDNGFASAVSGSLKVYDQTGTEVTSGWSLSGNTITFTEPGDQEYTIRYQTAAEQREYDAQTVTNTATAYHGNNHFETKTSTATIPANGTIEKELMPGATYTNGSDGNGAYREYTLTWHVYMPVPAVGFAAGTVITETLNAYVWNVNNSVRGNHYFTESQKTALLNALKVYFGNDFTLTWADDNSDSQNLKYTITLGSAWTNPSNVEALDFEYSTTGRLYMDNVTVKMGGSSSGDSFTNTITVGGVSDDAKWEYTQLLQKKARVGTSNYSNANLGEIHPSDQRTLTWDIILVLDNNYDSLSVTDTLPAGLTLKNILVGSEWNAWSLLKQSANASTFEILPNGTWYNGLGQEEGWNNYGDVYKSDATDGNRFGSSSENGLVATGSVSGQTVSVNLQMVGSDRPIVFTKGSVFFVRIVAHIDDGEFNDYTNQAKTYTNSASVYANGSPLGTASSSQTTTLVSDTLSKNEAHGSFNDNAEGGGNHTLNYTIDINKDGHSLLGGSEGTLTLDDVLSYVKDGSVDFTVMLVPDSVKLYEKVNDAWVEYHDPSEPWVYTFEERSGSGNTKEKLIHISGIPDGKILQLRYSYEIEVANAVKGTKYTLPTINNTSALTGTSIVTDSTQTTETWESFSTQAGTVSGGTLKVVKVDSQNYSTKLQGAKFKLEKYTTSGWVQIDAIGNGTENLNGHQVYVSNAKGLIQISQPVSGTQFDQNTAYRIVEVEAPEGYSVGNPAATAYFYFATTGTVNPVPSDENWSKADNLNVESDNMWIGNEKTPELIIVKSIQGEPITDAQKNGITFTVTDDQSATVGSPITLSAFTYDSTTGLYTYRITTGIENNKTYTVTESNMNVDGVKRVTVYSVNSKPAVAGGSASVPVRYGTGMVQFTNTYGETEITASKVWDDQNNANNSRPASIKLHLLQDGVDMGSAYERTLSADAWSASWTGLDVCHTYTVQEETVNGYAASVVYTQGGSTVDALTRDGSVTITNKLTRIYVEKEWAPTNETHSITSVEVELYKRPASGGDWASVSTQTLNSGNQWRAYWDNLEEGYTYKVVENTTSDIYTTTYKVNGADGDNEAVSLGAKVTVVNTKLKGLTVKKVWVDDGNARPTLIQFHLQQSDDGTTWTNLKEWVALNESNNWTQTYEGLNASKLYRVVEPYVPSGYTVTYSTDGDNWAQPGDTITITNTKQTTGIAVHKVWDVENPAEIKPVTVELWAADGSRANDAIQVTIIDKGSPDITDTKHVKSGSYVVLSGNFIQGATSIIINSEDGISRRTNGNTLKVGPITEETTISVTNEWGQSQAYTIDCEEKVDLTNPEKIETVTLGSDNNFYYEKTNLASNKYYYFVETKVNDVALESSGYEVSYSSNNTGIKTGTITITNSKQDTSTTSVSITKTWADQNDKYGLRPNADAYTAMVKLMNGASEVTGYTPTVTDNGDNTYTVTYSGLPILPEGQAYSVQEDTTALTNYSATVASAVNGGSITNTLKTGGLKVTKTVTGVTGQEAKTFNITVKNSANKYVAADGSLSDSQVILTVSQNAPLTISGLPYDTYTVTEITDSSANDSRAITGYKIAVSGNTTSGTATINDATASKTDQAEVVALTNAYEQDVTATATISGTKTLTGKTLTGDEFTFILEPVSGAPLNGQSQLTATNGNDGGFSFPAITYTLTDLDNNGEQDETKTFTYTVKEDVTGVDTTTHVKNNVLYDYDSENSRFKAITVTVTLTYVKNTNTLTAEVNQTAAQIAFTNTPQITTVTATKSWQDSENQDISTSLPAGTTVTFGLFRDGSETALITYQLTGTQTANENIPADGDTPAAYESAPWVVTFKNLPKYKADSSAASVYVVKETVGAAHFTNMNPDGVGNGDTITNKPESVSIEVTKAWSVDGNTAWPSDVTRVTVGLYVGDNAVQRNSEPYTITLDSNHTSASFTDLPKYDSNDQEITYTVREVSITKSDSSLVNVSEGTVDGYTVTGGTITFTDNTGAATFTNSKTTPSEQYVNITLTKAWNDPNADAEHQADAPTGEGTVKFALYRKTTTTTSGGGSVTVQLLAQDKTNVLGTAQGNVGDTVTFTYTGTSGNGSNILVQRSYYYNENDNGLHYEHLGVHTQPDNNGNGSFSYQIANNDVIENTIKLALETDIPFNSVSATGGQSGSTTTSGPVIYKTITLYSPTWTYTGSDLSNLPIRTQSGDTVTTYEYWLTETERTGAAEDYTIVTYAAALGKDADNPINTSGSVTVSVTNSKPELTTITAAKAWVNTTGNTWPQDANDEYTPEYVEVKLQRKIEGGEFADVDGVANQRIYPEESGDRHTTATFANLPVDDGNGHTYEYTVVETNVPTGYVSTVTDNYDGSFTVTNTKVPTVEITASKAWTSQDNTVKAVQFTLYASADETTYNSTNAADRFMRDETRYVKVTLDADGVAITNPAAVVATVNGDTVTWPNSASWTNLPAKDSQNEDITYYVKETGVYTDELDDGNLPAGAVFTAPTNYLTSGEGVVTISEGSGSITITNDTIPTVNVPVNKTWAAFDGTEYTWTATFRLEEREIHESGPAVDNPISVWTPVDPARTLTVFKGATGNDITFQNLPKYHVYENGGVYRVLYSVTETAYEVKQGDTVINQWDAVHGLTVGTDLYAPHITHDAGDTDDEQHLTENDTDFYTIIMANRVETFTPTTDTINVGLTKVWENNAADGVANANAVFQLKRYYQEGYREFKDNYDGTTTYTVTVGSKSLTVPKGAKVYIVATFKTAANGGKGNLIIREDGREVFSYNNTEESNINYVKRFDTFEVTGNVTYTLDGEGLLESYAISDLLEPTEWIPDGAYAVNITLDSINNWQWSSSLPVMALGTYDSATRLQTERVYAYYFEEVSSNPSGKYATYTSGNSNTPLGDVGHRITSNANVTATNKERTPFRVSKDWLDILGSDLSSYPEVYFTLYYMIDGTSEANKTHVYRPGGPNDDSFVDIPLNYANNWTWDCPVQLPERDEQGNLLKYFVVETPKTPQAVGQYSDIVKTSPDYSAITFGSDSNLVIKVDGYRSRSTIGSGAWNQPDYTASVTNDGTTSDVTQEGRALYDQPLTSAIGNTGEIQIRNKTLKYMQMDIKKKFLRLVENSTHNGYELRTLTSDNSVLHDLVLEIQIKRRTIAYNSDVTRAGLIPSGEYNVLHDWENYGASVLVGYNKTLENAVCVNPESNPFQIRYAGVWHWTIDNTNQNQGLPAYGIYNGQAVRYQYVLEEVGAYKDTNKTPLNNTDYEWTGILPAAWDGSGYQVELFPRITAQDQDRLVNVQTSNIQITKDWKADTDVQEVYVKIFRRTGNNTDGDGSRTEDFTNHLCTSSSQMVGGHDGLVSAASIYTKPGTTEKYLIIPANRTVTIEHVLTGNPSTDNTDSAYYYQVEECGYKDVYDHVYWDDEKFTPEYSYQSVLTQHDQMIVLGRKGGTLFKLINTPTTDFTVTKKWVVNGTEQSTPWTEGTPIDAVEFKVTRIKQKYTKTNASDTEWTSTGGTSTDDLSFVNNGVSSNTLMIQASGKRAQVAAQTAGGTSYTVNYITDNQVTIPAWTTVVDGLQKLNEVSDTEKWVYTYKIEEVAVKAGTTTIEATTYVTTYGGTGVTRDANGAITALADHAAATITNTKQEGISINVTKQWTKQNVARDDKTSIQFTLHQVLKSGGVEKEDKVYTDYGTKGKGTVEYRNGAWQITPITGLPLKGTATVKEGSGTTTIPNCDASYYVVEDAISADAGYVLVTTYSTQSSGTNAVSSGKDAAVSTNGATITIINTETPGVVLPSTGGPGTAVYTVTGLTLTLGAALWLMLRRRKEQQN